MWRSKWGLVICFRIEGFRRMSLVYGFVGTFE